MALDQFFYPAIVAAQAALAAVAFAAPIVAFIFLVMFAVKGFVRHG